MYSFIIPYKYHELRKNYDYILFCIDQLVNLTKNINSEICICETGPKSYLESLDLINDNNIKYLYIKSEGEFHRAWVLNLAVRYLSIGNYIILIDNDIIISTDWVEKLKKYTGNCAFGWKKINYLSDDATKKYMVTKSLNNLEVTKVFIPKVSAAAGGITVVKREVFFSINGVPEDFYPSWGGEDNAFVFKLKAYGYTLDQINEEIWHLFHPKTTKKELQVLKKLKLFKSFTKDNWEEHHNNLIYSWGNKNNQIFCTDTQSQNNYWFYDYNNNDNENDNENGNENKEVYPPVPLLIQPPIIPLSTVPKKKKKSLDLWRTKDEYNALPMRNKKHKKRDNSIKTTTVHLINNRLILGGNDKND